MDNQPKIVMYSTQWCGDCVRSKKVFDKLGIAFTEVDIDYDKEGFEIAKKIQNQNPRIPTIVFEMEAFWLNHQMLNLQIKLILYNQCNVTK